MMRALIYPKRQIAETVGGIIDKYGLNVYYSLSDQEDNDEYWSKHKLVMSSLNSILVENDTGTLAFSRKWLHGATKELLRVMNYIQKPIIPVEQSAQTATPDGIKEVKMGRAWQVYLFDGKSVLKDGDEIIIDSGEPLGKRRFKAKIRDSSTPFYQDVLKDYRKEIEIEMNMKDLMQMFGPKDHDGKEPKLAEQGWYLFTIKREAEIQKPASLD